MNWRTKLLLVVTVVVAVAGGVRWLGRSSEPASAQGPPASARVATSRCDPSDPTKAEIGFGWYGSAPWDEAWLDLSLENNGFIPGTFVGVGPIPPELTGNPSFEPYLAVYLWSGIEPGLTHYWRVNLRYGGAWYTSPTYTFDSPVCGGASPPSGSLPPGTLSTSDLEIRVGDLETRLGRLESRVGSLEDDLSRVQHRLDTVEGCLSVGRLLPSLSLFSCGTLYDLDRRVDNLEWGYP